MRRKEFGVEDTQEIEEFLREMSFGFLGTVGEDGWSRVTPLNFVYDGHCFYFHGSLAGEKMKHLAHDARVSFTVAKEYAIIPSYFTDPNLACPASAFFKSVMVRGRAEKVQNLEEKAAVLTLFMEKLQPEGGYDPIVADNSQYTGHLKSVSVVKIIPETISGKFKFGQNMNETKFSGVVQGLEERHQDLDPDTVELMKKYCPRHR
ncbi:nitroimidazol reductase NimA-like FMN-containing flavoprotein (pyridoxamine 5'-phosphate oxidase superfamily) [Fontibacillus phaseoli]|uniref:Nitroimidazol reductase NimA-like FMN-containing flavoprotein (Pyridoxamine 5'-phosphate oxidase superfamily) n=1 Tax=Fontibacillus phaseoli TaxID=1416533 RepID=A0A369BDW0_9BACL|nr:pyridoxamine 5'-phosphate oxidase family protein [Fontibacillus phaseoli]RCX19752.1 nitroimidazol reductase NimA-like FMN-containing flavoprotein (pyridoxamine 5'-phosphate oxidase superfamily) [Fontibacillus phaseoli]